MGVIAGHENTDWVYAFISRSLREKAGGLGPQKQQLRAPISWNSGSLGFPTRRSCTFNVYLAELKYLVVYVHGVELVGGDSRADWCSRAVSAESHPLDLALRPVLVHNLHAASLPDCPFQLLHGVDAMEGKDVEVLHLWTRK